jgi:hypothetical protein
MKNGLDEGSDLQAFQCALLLLSDLPAGFPSERCHYRIYVFSARQKNCETEIVSVSTYKDLPPAVSGSCLHPRYVFYRAEKTYTI